ncbi:sensor histidine kinase [Candidatus Neomarinimicrobiota bacterium]
MLKGTFSASIKHSFYTPNSLRRKNLWLVNVRWASSIALAIFISTLFIFKFEEYPYFALIEIILILLVFNSFLLFYLKKRKPKYLKTEEYLVLAQIIIDYVLLTVLVHFTGGIDSPLHLIYLFHIIIASVIFEKKYQAFIIAAVAVLSLSILVFMEYVHMLSHFSSGVKVYNMYDIILALSVFYVTIFTSTYMSVTLMKRHKKVKNLIFAQNEELEKADKEKMQFFQLVSHELKSPIIAVQSSINVVLDVMDTNLKPKARDMLERARKRTQQMIEILKDLVSLSYEETVEEHGHELVVPCEHIPEVIDYYRPLAEEKNIQLIETVCKQRKGFQLDKFIFEKIITNLMSNAVRYTPKGGKVTIKTDYDDNYWYLLISDTGIGIPEDEQELIFQEFYRARNAKKFDVVGTGLGMSIVKKLVEQENGEVSLVSNVGHGSTVTVKFPLK